ncbi:MAG: hypothetical protein OIN66_01050 [Candidatus Methanoperedens sp.]|nr:hypothetical protein [Candidatus Methanoperedens sp.]
MNPVICSAIRSKQIIRFDYSGGLRTIEPFCYGVSTSGNEILRAYQRDGYSVSGKPAGWKLFRISGVSNLTVTDEHFDGNRPEYRSKDSAMATIYCCV